MEPWNDLEPTTKLQWALQMAEAVAVLNNFEHGVIVHDDIQPPQFLPTKDGKLKFVSFSSVVCCFLLFARTTERLTLCDTLLVIKNDFNRAEIMLFDEENQEYCRYRNDVGPADVRIFI